MVNRYKINGNRFSRGFAVSMQTHRRYVAGKGNWLLYRRRDEGYHGTHVRVLKGKTVTAVL